MALSTARKLQTSETPEVQIWALEAPHAAPPASASEQQASMFEGFELRRGSSGPLDKLGRRPPREGSGQNSKLR
eukprot:3210087-Alexandrium_andersonii.AAC.1